MKRKSHRMVDGGREKGKYSKVMGLNKSKCYINSFNLMQYGNILEFFGPYSVFLAGKMQF